MIPMNSPLFSIVNMMRSGKNPGAIIEQLAMSDPRVKQVKQMVAGKSERELYTLVSNMCRERGTTAEDFARSLGIQIPSNR